MHHKIEKSGCNERKGLCEIRYDLFLDPGDDGYDVHYVNVPVWPEGGYPGVVDVMGIPSSQQDYDTWLTGLPRVWQNNPFCCHFMQHEPTVTDAEILASGEKFLAMAYENWQKGDLHLNKNVPVNLLPLEIYRALEPFVEAEIGLEKKGKPLKDKLVALGGYLDTLASELSLGFADTATAKIKASSKRIEQVLMTDFEALRAV